MNRIVINSIEINYLDHLPDKEETILLIHGNSHSSRTFRHQFADNKLRRFRLLAIDLPGHGLSDSMENYSVPSFVSILTDFCQALGINRPLLVGHSLGGHIAIEAAEAVDASGLLIYGTPPLSKPLDFSGFKPNPGMALALKGHLDETEIVRLIHNFYDTELIDPIDIEDINRTDESFRPLMFQSFCEEKFTDEVKTFNDFSKPKSIINAMNDKLVDGNYFEKRINLSNLWKGEVIQINSSHNVHVENPQEFNQKLVEFAEFIYESNVVSHNLPVEGLVAR